MLVVSIIALLTVIAIPSFIKSRKQAQARRAINDVRQMDAAIDQWVQEFNKKDGDDVDTNGAVAYMHPLRWNVKDPVGNPYVIGKVGTNQITISTSSKSALAGVGVDWGSY